MRSKGRTILVVCVAALALSAIASASASAAVRWEINGQTLSTQATISMTTGPLQLEWVINGTRLYAECQTSTASGAEIFNVDEGEDSGLVLKGCAMRIPSTCTIPSTITTKKLKTKIFDVGTEEVWEEFSEGAGETEWVKTSLTECALEAGYKLTGCTAAKVIDPNVNEVTKDFEFVGRLPAAVENATGCKGLHFGGNPFILVASGSSELTGVDAGDKWTSHY